MNSYFEKISRDLDLPPDWEFLGRVTPALFRHPPWERPIRTLETIERGLTLMERRPEQVAYALTAGTVMHRKSGLCMPLPDWVWDRAERLRRSWQAEIQSTPKRRWTARRILLSALYLQAERETAPHQHPKRFLVSLGAP
jgi:hypothetical protein